MKQEEKQNKKEYKEEQRGIRRTARRWECWYICAMTAVITALLTIMFIFHSGHFLVLRMGQPDRTAARKVREVNDMLHRFYFEEFDQENFLDGIARGMAESMDDPYTRYFSVEEMELYTAFLSDTQEEYQGIGVAIRQDLKGMFEIMDVFPDSPAHRAGLQAGDLIFELNGVDVTQITEKQELIEMIRAVSPGESLNMVIYRRSVDMHITVDIYVDMVRHYLNISFRMLENDIGYIRLEKFDNVIADAFEEAVNELKEEGMQALIVDVRDNPGGVYTQVIRIADLLLPEGLIVYAEDRRGNRTEEHSSADALGLPLAILINGRSASASEVLAGAVRDLEAGWLVGENTYGKGLVQSLFTLEDQSGLKVTTARYFTPSGESIHGIGIAPHVTISLDAEFENMPVIGIPLEHDLQLQAALVLIREQL